MIKRLVIIGGFAAAVALAFYIDWSFRSSKREEVRGYASPRLPKYLFKEPSDEEMTRIARGLARQTETRNGRLGVLSQGEKGLIVIDEGQDMRIIQAAIKALRERGADADYVSNSQLLMSEKQMSQETAKAGRQRQSREGPSGGANSTFFREGILEALFGYGVRFFPNELLARMPEINVERLRQSDARQELLVSALKSYMDRHPEYRYAFVGFWAGGPLRRVLFEALGDRFQEGWRYPDMLSLISESTAFPADLLRALEEKVMEVIPWIQDVHVTDPEGTDLRYSVSPGEAEIWATRPYFENYIMMYPLQATADLYQYADVWKAKRIEQHVIPNANGVVVASRNHTGNYSTMKVTIREGQVEKVEGGGRVGDEVRTFLGKRYREAHYPYHPRPGFLYLFQNTVSVNPKTVRDYRGNDVGRAGVMVFGYGAESTIPKVIEFAEKNDLPLHHSTHMHQYFPTYEAKLRGTNESIKVVDKGHLVAFDDPEIRALASKYGKADEILTLDWVPALPGVNIPGEYAKDYGSDPSAYFKKEWEQIQQGKYPYLIDRPTPIY